MKYRVRWNRPTISPGYEDVVYGSISNVEFEGEVFPLDSWTKVQSLVQEFDSREEAVRSLRRRQDFLCINPESPVIFIEVFDRAAWRVSR